MMYIKHLGPVNGNKYQLRGRRQRIITCIALAMLISALPVRSETFSPPTKPTPNPLPAATTTATVTNQFSLAIEPRPKNYPATNGVYAGSSDATRRVLAAATFLNKQQVAAKGSFGSLFSTKVGERGFSIAGIQAGYGMVCLDPAYTHGRNGTAREEPSYFVLKTSLKF